MLCDRLGIFVDGQLVCIGNPKEITGRYAGYFVFTITVLQVGHLGLSILRVSHKPPVVGSWVGYLFGGYLVGWLVGWLIGWSVFFLPSNGSL